MMVDAVISEGGEEVSSEHAGKDEGDDDGEDDSKTNRANAGSEVGACVLNLVDNVECPGWRRYRRRRTRWLQ